MFSFGTTLEEFENAIISGHCGFVFQENSIREIASGSSFSKSSVFKMFSSTLKRIASTSFPGSLLWPSPRSRPRDLARSKR